ncbi:hypothetical protein HDV57DRAFT_497129 [Trichoderma longibrachiatum]
MARMMTSTFPPLLLSYYLGSSHGLNERTHSKKKDDAKIAADRKKKVDRGTNREAFSFLSLSMALFLRFSTYGLLFDPPGWIGGPFYRGKVGQ